MRHRPVLENPLVLLTMFLFLHGLIINMLNGGRHFYCAFIDFTKTFDYVVRYMLWYKLIKLGLRGQILKVIKSMYENIKYRVKSHNELSDEF